MKTKIERIAQQTLCDFLENENLAKHTTLRVGGPADAMFFPKNVNECIAVLDAVLQEKIPFQIIGSGSNILAADKGFKGIIIKLTSLNNLLFNDTIVTADSGVFLPTLAIEAANKGLSGLEFAAGIPGTVGGAVKMNAGAEGKSIQDIFCSSLVWENGSLKKLSLDEMQFSYRTSTYKEKAGVILQSQFQLEYGNEEKIKEKIKEYLTVRKAKQPLQFPNAGSIFKNPPDNFAGKIIAEIGLQGKQIGGAMVSDKHANFIINIGNATALDIKSLIDLVQEQVLTLRGILLEPEVEFIGEF